MSLPIGRKRTLKSVFSTTSPIRVSLFRQRLLFRPPGSLVLIVALGMRPRRKATEDGPGGVPNSH